VLQGEPPSGDLVVQAIERTAGVILAVPEWL
jgi:hypothetical protein